MLLHPILLTLALILFIAGAAVGFASLKRKAAGALPADGKSKHMYLVYSAYLLFLIALAVYVYERANVLTPGQIGSVRKSGLLIYHVASISAAAIFTTAALAYGIIFRNTLFQEGVRKKEILHLALGVLAVASFALGVITGVVLYAKAGIPIL